MPKRIIMGRNKVKYDNGIYICHTNDKLYTRAQWDTSWNNAAAGLAIITDKCQYLIAPDDVGVDYWSGVTVLVNGIFTTQDASVAITDYNGKDNTDKAISQLGSNALAFNPARNYTFKNGQKGYLGGMGEWYEAYRYKPEVDAYMSLIGGTALWDVYDRGPWTSTQHGDTGAWDIFWSDGTIDPASKHYTKRMIRPFASL